MTPRPSKAVRYPKRETSGSVGSFGRAGEGGGGGATEAPFSSVMVMGPGLAVCREI